MYQAFAMIVRGWALNEQRREVEAIDEMHQGLAALQAMGAEVARSHFLALLAEALGKSGQAEEGLRVLEEALVVAHRSGERYYQAELYRLKGELLLEVSTGRRLSRAATGGRAVVESEPPTVTSPEDCFHQAIRIAQRQKAKSLELRSIMSVARLYQKESKQQEARGLLAQIYDRFSEGSDTVDLREAKALLDALS